MQSHEAVVAEEAEKEQMGSMIKDTLIEQEPEVIAYEAPVKRMRTPLRQPSQFNNFMMLSTHQQSNKNQKQ